MIKYLFMVISALLLVGCSTGIKFLTSEEIKSIAFEHANINSADNVYDLDIDLEIENNRLFYEIEWKQNNTKYEYDIDALSGEIFYFNNKPRT